MKIVHIIIGLGDGGAERSLFNVCRNDINNQHVIVSLTPQKKYDRLLKKLGFKVYQFNLKKNIFFFNVVSLIRIIHIEKPDITQTWMYHADFFGSICSLLAGYNKIIWNIRHSKFEKKSRFNLTIYIAKILAKLSWWIPKKIIVNSKAAFKYHKQLGYCSKKFFYIPNGYDLSHFKLKNKNLFFVRKKYNIKKNIPLIGFIARHEISKDHINLLNSLKILKNDNNKFFCVFVGSNINNNIELKSVINKLKLNDCVKLMGPQEDIAVLMSELDLHILSSRTESFPNVVAETMACEVPNVVTNVGDAMHIVGNTGWIVPKKNKVKLANAISAALAEIKKDDLFKKRKKNCRLRIEQKFQIQKMINTYNILWNKVLNIN